MTTPLTPEEVRDAFVACDEASAAFYKALERWEGLSIKADEAAEQLRALRRAWSEKKAIREQMKTTYRIQLENGGCVVKGETQ